MINSFEGFTSYIYFIDLKLLFKPFFSFTFSCFLFIFWEGAPDRLAKAFISVLIEKKGFHFKAKYIFAAYRMEKDREAW